MVLSGTYNFSRAYSYFDAIKNVAAKIKTKYYTENTMIYFIKFSKFNRPPSR